MDSEENKPAEQSPQEPASDSSEAPVGAAVDAASPAQAGVEDAGTGDTPQESVPEPEEKASAPKNVLLMERMPAKPPEEGDEKDGDVEPGREDGEETGDGLQGRSTEDIDRARNRQKAFLQKRRRQKKLRVLYGRLRILIKLCFAAVLAFAIWEFATADLWVFDGRRVSLSALELLEPEEIMPVIEAYTGEPVYSIDPQQIETILKGKYPVISELYVRRRLFPARLELTLLEKKPWGELYRKFGDERPYAIVGADYRPVLLKPYARAKSAFPDDRLARLMLPPASILTPEYLEELDVLTYQLGSIRGLSLGFVDARNPHNIDAYFEHVRVRIGRLDATTPERLARLGPLVPEINRLRGEIDQVDLRWLNQVAFHKGKTPMPVLGLQPEPPPKAEDPENPDSAPEAAPSTPVSSVQGE